MRKPRSFLLLSCLLSSAAVFGQAIPVELQSTEQGWQLLRGGKPYFIRGAGGTGSLRQLAAAGANSVRTWGADDLDALLDEAHELGLSVTIGIWLGHERHGFDYRDESQVREQFERARRYVLRYREHPALLLWGIGNEMEGFADGDNPLIWAAVNDIAEMIRELDPVHPTMTVTAEIGGSRIESVHEKSPAIDIHGINSYGGALSLAQRYRAAGGSKPYVLTEFGPPGTWETQSTAWDAPYEMTSTDKAAFYRRSYREAVIGAPGLALGSYVFNWGYKMEATATWYGMFLPDGSRLGAIDAMTELWSGKPAADLAPTVEPLVIEGDARFRPGGELRVAVAAADPEGGPLRVRWALRRESGDYAAGGDFRPMLPDIEGAIREGRQDGAVLRLPREPGPYRLFVYVYDESGNAATANQPLFVEGEVRTPMPFYVYSDGFEGMPWAPSGWMGAIDALSLDGSHADAPHEGSASIRLRYEGRVRLGGSRLAAPGQQLGRDGRRLRSERCSEAGVVGPRRIRRRTHQYRRWSPGCGRGVSRFRHGQRRRYRADPGMAALSYSPEARGLVEYQDGFRGYPPRQGEPGNRLSGQHSLRALSYRGTGPVDSRICSVAGTTSAPATGGPLPKLSISVIAARSAIVARGWRMVVSVG